MNSLKNLHTVRFQGNEITDKGIKLFSFNTQKLKNLEVINFGDN